MTIGDRTCTHNARSSYLRCAINPCGPCEGCADHISVVPVVEDKTVVIQALPLEDQLEALRAQHREQMQALIIEKETALQIMQAELGRLISVEGAQSFLVATHRQHLEFRTHDFDSEVALMKVMHQSAELNLELEIERQRCEEAANTARQHANIVGVSDLRLVIGDRELPLSGVRELHLQSTPRQDPDTISLRGRWLNNGFRRLLKSLRPDTSARHSTDDPESSHLP